MIEANGLFCSAHARRIGSAADAGFTLIEILLVLTFIGLVVDRGGPRVLSYLGASRVNAANLQIESFNSALDQFNEDTWRYPTNSERFNAHTEHALTQRPMNVEWNDPYPKGGQLPLDPWGIAYQCRSPVERATSYEIISFGFDPRKGGTGTAAEISNVEF